MSAARYIIGDTLTVLRTMPDASVDLILTSPPFLAVRSYLPAGHSDKNKEMGSEGSPGEFIDALLDVVEECRRVLAPHGSLCFELGDTYAGSGGAGGDYASGGRRDGQEKFDGSARRGRARAGGEDGRPSIPGRKHYTVNKSGEEWPLAKSLCLIPELFRFALVYGFNPLTRRQTPRWRARNVVRWCRPNPPVGALGDKVRPATSDLLIACVNDRRYFDLDAIREPNSANTHARTAQGIASRPNNGKSGNFSTLDVVHDTNGAPPLDHWWHNDLFDQDAWHILVQPYRGAHYATWPEELCRKPILAMCPLRVCRTCGKPSERITETEQIATRSTNGRKAYPERGSKCENFDQRTEARVSTVAWSDCGHNTWRQGVVLDPFAGTGTTLLVAIGHGRSAIGIDIDERNADLARDRVGMFLTVEHHNALPTDADARDRAVNVPTGKWL